MSPQRYLLSGLLFSSIPVVALILHLAIFREPATVESSAMLVYAPAAFLFLGAALEGISPGGVLLATMVGTGVTLALWFTIGNVLAWFAQHISTKYFQVIIGGLFAVTLFLTVIVPLFYWRG